MKNEIKFKALIPALAIPLAVGAAAAFLTREEMALYSAMPKPAFSPPAWLFPIVWTLLYLMMGYASYLVLVSKASAPRKERAVNAYALSLAANFVWPILFFGMGLYFLSFLWAILLLLLSSAAALLFAYISAKAGRLMLPSLIWLFFAVCLNFAIWILNK